MSYYSKDDDISYTPLTPEQEGELFRQFYAGEISARDTIITHHLKLVAKLSLSYAKRAIPEDDAISAGNLGLMQSLEARRFDPTRGIRFASYLRNFVKGQVLRAIKERSILTEQSNSKRHAEEAIVTGAFATDIDYRKNRVRSVNPLDTTTEQEYQAGVNFSDRKQKLYAALEKIGATHPLEARAIKCVDIEGMSFQDVAKEDGISRQAVHQAYNRGMVKLKKLLTSRRYLVD